MRLSELLAICRREMAGVRDAAPGEAEILVSAVTGVPRSRLFLSMDDDVGDASVRLFPLIARRSACEPRAVQRAEDRRRASAAARWRPG